MSNMILKILDPFHIVRTMFLIPATLLGFVDLRQHERNNMNHVDGESSQEEGQQKTRAESPTARDFALKTTFVTFAAAIIIWVSIFMYITFYYTYMPAIEHLRPVYIQYE